MGSTLTTFDAFLKEKYDDGLVEKLIYPENPLFAKLSKDTDMVGDNFPCPIEVGLPQGLSGSFANAQNNNTNVVGYKWNITSGDYYGTVRIGDKVIEASKTNKGAFLADKELEIDGLFEQASEVLSVYNWGNGGQALGRIAEISSNTLTLVEGADAQNFEVGMKVVASAADGATSTDTLRDSGDASAVTAVDRGLGKITITVADISGLLVGDYLFRHGDFFGDTGTVIIKGVQAFITESNTPPTLWGITNSTRATDPQRFSGCKVDPTTIVGKTIEERIKILISQMAGRFKVKTAGLTGWLNPEDWLLLESALSARGLRPLQDDDATFGFAKIVVATSAGNIPIYADRHCPKGHFFALRLADFGIKSMGKLLHFQNGDGLEVLRVYNSTDYEARLLSYPLLYCRAPKNQGRVALY